VAVGSALLVGGVSTAAGGYFPTSWGWTALVLLWVVAVTLLVRSDAEIGALDLAFLSALTLLGGWTWLSTVWSESMPASFLEGERVLVFIAAAAAGLVIVRRRSVPQLLGGMLAGITLISAWGLATRLFPNRIGTFDPVAGYRLEEPVGYWNALGIIAAIGVLLALGFAARGRSTAIRALAGGSLAFLLPAFYFTYSRGSWVALGIGILVAVAFEKRRLQLAAAFIVALLAPGLSVLLATRYDALTNKTASIAAATHDGQRYALVVLATAILSAALTAAFGAAESRVAVSRGVRVVFGAVLLALLVAAIGAGIARYGSPPTIVRHTYDRFTANPKETSADLNKRLFSISGNGRAQLWKVAWHDYEAHPWLGSGAGTYEQQWYRHRTSDLAVRDAHNLYLEQLAELGPLGLGLLALALAMPFVAAFRARDSRLTGVALAGYVAFVLHAAVDWDWEVTAVTLTGLLCGIALLAAARRERSARPLAAPLRFGAVGAVAALAALALVGLVGNLALAASSHAAARGDWRKAVAQANRASSWAPWSAEALRRLGEARFGQGDERLAAAAFRRAVAKDPGNWELWLDVYRTTSGAEAETAFKRTYRLNPRG
jgi:tetratricopeptide (TPR) repeat protein